MGSCFRNPDAAAGFYVKRLPLLLT